MIAQSILPFLSGIVIICTGIFVLSKNFKSKLNILFFLECLTLFLWLFGYSRMYATLDREIALRWARVGYIGIISIPIFIYHFYLEFLKLQKKKIILLMYLLSIFFLSISQTNLIYQRTDKYFWGWYPRAGIIYPFYVLFFFGVFIRSLILLYTSLKDIKIKSSIRYNQLKYLLAAFFIASFGGVDYIAKFGISIYPFGYLAALGWILIVAFAIVKYHLLDITVALTRAGIFIVVYALVLGIPFWLGYATKAWLPATALAVLLATLGPFIYQYLRRRAEDVLLRDQRRYHATLRELSKTMTRIRDLDQLLKAIVLTVFDTVKVSFAAIYLKDEEYKSYRLKHYFPKKAQSRFQESIPLDYSLIKLLIQQKRPLLSEEAGLQDKVSLDSGLAIPCFMEDDLLGFMVLGAKPNNQMYTPDDLIVFETLSYSTGLAIENCIFWKEIEDRQRKARLQEMDTYSYSLAHEIDNPMQTVIGQAGLLQKYLLKDLNLTEEKRQDLSSSLDFILEAARRVSGMVKAIREFGQRTTGEPKPLKIDDVVESFAKLYYPQFKAKTVLFEKTSNLKNPVFVLGEKPELMQVLVIIANNSLHAMTYSKEKKITLTIEQPNPDWVNIIFTDTGHGINKELLPIIFSPFTTTKASTEGTGMGLYNAKKIIDRYKGKIWAQSEGPDKGATFIIELPIARDIKPEELRLENKGKRLF